MLDVRTFQSLANRQEYMTEKGAVCSLKQLELSEKCEGYQQISILDLLSGKTSQEHSAQTKEKTSEQSSMRSYPSLTAEFLFLDLKTGSGNMLGIYWETGTVLHGESSMRNTSELPRDVRDCSLSQILQVTAPAKYYLSQKACLGILRRAEKRKKKLPPMLKEALMEVTGSDGVSNNEQSSGPDQPVAYGVSRSMLKGGMNAGGMPVEKNIQPTMTSNGCGAVCYAIENHPNDSRVTVDPNGIVQTLSSRMGTG